MKSMLLGSITPSEAPYRIYNYAIAFMLTLSMLGKIVADDIFKYFFFLFFSEIGFDTKSNWSL